MCLTIASPRVALNMVVVHNEEGVLTQQQKTQMIIFILMFQPMMLGKVKMKCFLFTIDLKPCPYEILTSMNGF